jgi:hypothetical protein
VIHVLFVASGRYGVVGREILVVAISCSKKDLPVPIMG